MIVHADFKKDDELQQGADTNIQSYIEEPEIHIIALSSSSQEDQAALISDRLECIKELMTTTNGIVVTDKLFFFTGDKPAAQFERGTQQGGYYKCGSCGCRSTRMDDLAYSLNCKWRSMGDLQTLVLAGELVVDLTHVSTYCHPRCPVCISLYGPCNKLLVSHSLKLKPLYHQQC